MKKILLLIIIFFIQKANAQITYTFTGNGYWTAAGNWSNNIIPPATLPAGSTINIATSPGDSCVLNTVQTISSGAFLTIFSESNFIISGGILNNAEGTWLDKIILTSTDELGTVATNTLMYTYDSLKRIINVKDSISGGNEHHTENDISWYYKNADTLPFKVEWNSNLPYFQDTSLIYISYNDKGQRITDTVYNKRTLFYSYQSEKIITRKYEYFLDFIYGESFDSVINGGTIPINFKDTAWLDAQGNVILNKRYDLASNELLHSGKYVYDDHPNPVYGLSNALAYHIFPTDITSPWFHPQPNNLLSSEESSSMLGESNFKYDFSYHANGQPKQCVRTDLSGQKVTVTYVYRIF